MDKTTNSIITITKALVPDAKIILFGSRARGDYTKESDFDIAIISAQATNKRALYSQLNKAIYEKIQQPIDLVLYTPEEYEQGKNGFLPELIEKEGIPLTS